MRHLLAISTALALLLTSGGVVTAQPEDGAPTPAGAFTPVGSLALARTGHTATLLPDGRVLISGGEGLDPEDLSTAEVWDPQTATFGPAESLVEPRPEPLAEAETDRTGHTATLLPDGRALVIGGTADGVPIPEAELHAPGAEAAIPAGILAEPRSGQSATFLRDGRVLVVGGTGPEGALASAEIWTSAKRPAKCLGKRPTLFAQPGVELVGSKGDDVIAGSVGDDLIRGGGGNDRICGYGGADTLDGGGGNDRIDGGPGSDTITGAGGKDRLTGAAGADTLNGGKGKDVCVGGPGTDWLPGCNEAKRTRGTIVVKRNLKLKGPHMGALVIGRNGVTLDCDGHTITGPGTDVGSYGVLLVGRKRVTVRNCETRDHFHGVWLTASDRNTITDNRVSRAIQPFILIEDSDRNKVLRNSVEDSELGFGIYQLSDDNVIRGNTVTGGAEVGGFIVAGGRDNSFISNIARDGGHHGFSAGTNHLGQVALRNTFAGNEAIDNDGLGFADATTGYRGDAGTDNFYEDNICRGNQGGDSSPATLCD